MQECISKLAALGCQHRERLHQSAVAFRREPQKCDARVLLRLLALDQADLLGAADELRDRALRQLESVRERRHRRLLRAALGALDHEKEQIALRREPRLACNTFAAAKKTAKRGAELRDRDDVFDLWRVHSGRILALLPSRDSTRVSRFGASAWRTLATR